jgi:predicted RNase H-like HicB family nuclease
MGYRAVVHRAEEGGYWAEVPELPGLVTEAETLDQLVDALNEAVAGWLEADAKRSSHGDAAARAGRVQTLELAA